MIRPGGGSSSGTALPAGSSNKRRGGDDDNARHAEGCPDPQGDRGADSVLALSSPSCEVVVGHLLRIWPFHGNRRQPFASSRSGQRMAMSMTNDPVGVAPIASKGTVVVTLVVTLGSQMPAKLEVPWRRLGSGLPSGMAGYSGRNGDRTGGRLRYLFGTGGHPCLGSTLDPPCSASS
jgi:hypothetical protein